MFDLLSLLHFQPSTIYVAQNANEMISKRNRTCERWFRIEIKCIQATRPTPLGFQCNKYISINNFYCTTMCSIDRRANRFVSTKWAGFTSIGSYFSIPFMVAHGKMADGWEMVRDLLLPLISRRSHWWQLWLSNHLVAGYLVFLLTLGEGSPFDIYPFWSHLSMCVRARVFAIREMLVQRFECK